MLGTHATGAVVGLLRQGYPVGPADHLLVAVMDAGWAGVDLFFVLSGYLITGILLKAKGEPGYYRNFYARRALRILPLYYAVLLARLVLARVGDPWPALVVESWVSHALLVGNFWQCYAREAGVAFDPGGLHVGWSLAVEEQFYLAWPVVVALVSRAGLWRVCVAGVIAAPLLRWGLTAAGYDYWLPYALAPCRMDALLLGGLVALLATSGVPPAAYARRAWAVLAAAAAGVAGVLAANDGAYCHGPVMAVVGYSVIDVFFAAAVFLVVAGQPAGWRWLRFRPLVRVGERSYAIYLVHFPVTLGAYHLFQAEAVRGVLLPACEAVGSAGPFYAAFAGFVLGVSLLIAALAWVLVERPCLRLKRYFPAGGDGRPR